SGRERAIAQYGHAAAQLRGGGQLESGLSASVATSPRTTVAFCQVGCSIVDENTYFGIAFRRWAYGPVCWGIVSAKYSYVRRPMSIPSLAFSCSAIPAERRRRSTRRRRPHPLDVGGPAI